MIKDFSVQNLEKAPSHSNFDRLTHSQWRRVAKSQSDRKRLRKHEFITPINLGHFYMQEVLQIS